MPLGFNELGKLTLFRTRNSATCTRSDNSCVMSRSKSYSRPLAAVKAMRDLMPLHPSKQIVLVHRSKLRFPSLLARLLGMGITLISRIECTISRMFRSGLMTVRHGPLLTAPCEVRMNVPLCHAVSVCPSKLTCLHHAAGPKERNRHLTPMTRNHLRRPSMLRKHCRCLRVPPTQPSQSRNAANLSTCIFCRWYFLIPLCRAFFNRAVIFMVRCLIYSNRCDASCLFRIRVSRSLWKLGSRRFRGQGWFWW